MPIVPSRDSFSTMPTLNPSVRVQNTQSAGENRIAGEQLKARGQATEDFGKQQVNQEFDRMQEANALRAEDALNQVSERATRLQYDPENGYDNIKGYDALNRPDGVPLADEYGSKLESHIGEVEATLSNPEQKRMFREKADQLKSRFKDQAVQYEGTQFQEYSKSVREGTIKNRVQNIALNYDKPDVVKDDIIAIGASSRDLSRQLGKAANYGDAAAREQMSKGHRIVIETALQKENYKYADEYFKSNAKDMEPDDILWANASLGGELDTQLAASAVGKVIQGEIKNIITPDSDRAFNIAIGSESGGDHFGGAGSVAGPNEPTTSPKGAIGIAQVMPDTAPEAAELAGLPWDKERYKNDPQYNYALGKAYFEKQLKDFGGSLAKAYAAYNWGPAALKGAIAKHGEAWLSHAPAETRAYVAKNMKEFEAGQGQNKAPTLLEIKDKIRAQIGEDKPKRLKMALDEAERQYGDIQKAVVQKRDESKTEAMRQLIANGGNFPALPANVRGNLDPEDVGGVMDFAKKLSSGSVVTDLSLYNRYTAHPEELAAMSDAKFEQLRANFTDTDFKHFSEERAKILNGTQPAGQNPGTLNSSAIKSVLDDRLRTLGIDPSPSDDKAPKDAARVGAIRKFVNDSVIAAQAGVGKQMNDAETSKFIDDLFARKSISERWYGNTSKPMLEMKVSDIPSDTLSALKTAFRNKGIDPTDTDLMNVYWAQQLKQTDKGAF